VDGGWDCHGECLRPAVSGAPPPAPRWRAAGVLVQHASGLTAEPRRWPRRACCPPTRADLQWRRHARFPHPGLTCSGCAVACPLQIQNQGYSNLYVNSVKVIVKDIWGYYYTTYANCPSSLVPWVNAPGAYGTQQCNWQLGTW